MKRIVTLPDRGRLIIATDIQGNVRDFERVAEIFEQAIQHPDGAVLVVTGDLVHGPELQLDEWPPHLGTYYAGDSPRVVELAMELADRHPGHVHYLLGNHEHAHIGGPIVAKFFPNEAERLEALLGPRAEAFQEWIRDWPWLAIAEKAGIVMSHAAPHAHLTGREELEKVELEIRPEDEGNLEGTSPLIPLLWARTTTTQRALSFMRALGPGLRVSVYGHDVAHAGFAIDREPLLCVSTSFGCYDGDKLFVSWDLSRAAESAEHVARQGLRRLWPAEPPVHRTFETIA